jgi:hypothetical protein
MQKFKGAISQGEREFLKEMAPGLTTPAQRQLLEEMLRQSPPLIRGMNSQTRIDMLKPPKFRK